MPEAHRPSPAAVWLLSLAAVAVWVTLRLVMGGTLGAMLPLTFVVPLLLGVWTRNRRAVWMMAAIFAIAHLVEVLVVLPPEAIPGGQRLTTLLASLCNIVVGAAVVQMIITLRIRLEQSLTDLAAHTERVLAQSHELTTQNARLMEQGEEISRQSEEINAQAEELAEQNEELHVQFEEIQGLNQTLGRQEQLLQALLDAAQHADSRESAFRHIVTATIGIVGSPARAAAIYERVDGAISVRAATGLGDESLALLTDTFVTLVLAQGRPAALTDASLRPDLHLPLVDGRRPASVMCAPMVTAGGVACVLAIYGESVHAWTEDQFRLATWLSGETVRAIEFMRLQDDLQRQAALVDVTPDPILVRTLEGRILQWNSAAEQLYGWSRQEAVGQLAQQLLRSEYPVPMSEIVAEIQKTGTWVGDVTKYAKDGRALIVQSRWSGRRNAAGDLVEMLESTVDVSARHRAEDELREANRQKSEFLATLSHELRNPLAPMRYALGLLGVDSGAHVPEPLQVIDRQLAHLTRLVDDLLDATRIARNKIQLRKERADVVDLVHQAIAAVFRPGQSDPHECRVALPSGPLWADVDPDRVGQVITNLLSNAARYTPSGGKVDVSVTLAGRDVVITVSDTGIGIRAEDLDRVFDMFTQVSGPGGGGLGIGLALVRRIVELHGGSVRAESDGPGRGSRFTVRLPHVAELPTGSPMREAPAKRPEGRRVLVVDDNVDSAEMMKALLALDGHDVRVAYDGVTAIGLATEFVPHVALLDIGLPGVSGYELARRLRHDPATRHVRLVAVTGWGHEHDRQRAREAGFDAHLTKPADPHVIAKLVDGVTD